MSQPDVGDLHVDALLTTMSIAYMQDEDNFIADKVFPFIFVDKQTDLYPRYNKEAWYRDQGERMRRAPGTKAARTGWTIDTNESYRCQNEAIGTTIPDEVRGNHDAVYNLDADATRLVTIQQMIRRERLWAERYMSTGKWTTNKAGTTDFTKWSDYGNSDPFKDFETYRNTMRLLIGRFPNTVVMGYDVWRYLKHHPDFLDRIKGGATTGNPAMLTQSQFSAFIEIPRILMPTSVYNTQAEPLTAVLADIVGDDVLMVYTPAAASLLTPAAGYTFVWRPLTNGNAPQYIRRYREDPEKQDVIESWSYIDQVITAPDAGVLLKDCV